jgi:quercetin dioxygenase-like cupin family protein
MKKLFFLLLGAGLLSGCNTAPRQFAHESESWKLSSELKTEQVKPGLQRQVMCYNDDIMLVKVIFGEEMVGQQPALHSHPHSQSSYILSGKFELHCGDKVQILSAGDAFYAQPNIPHEVYCLEPGIIIDGFSPIREEFLK